MWIHARKCRSTISVVSTVAVICLASFASPGTQLSAQALQEKPKQDAKLAKLIADLESALPAHEADTDNAEKGLQPFLNSKTLDVATAVDAALLQVQATRSVRKIIAHQPEYLTYHIGPASLTQWN